MWVTLSLSSRFAQKLGTRYRFELDDLIQSVARIHLVTLETSKTSYLAPRSLFLYFSEQAGYGQLTYFKAQVPVGQYLPDQLMTALQMSAACAMSLNYPGERPANSYTFDLHQDTGTVTVRSSGVCSFSIHNVCRPYVGHVNRLASPTRIHVLLSDDGAASFATGALVRVFGEDTEVSEAQVVGVVGSELLLETGSALNVQLFSEMTIEALSSVDSVSRVLGMGDRDISSEGWHPINAVGTYTVEDGGNIDSDLLLSTLLPTGLRQGDTLDVRTGAGVTYSGIVDYVRGLFTAVNVSESVPSQQLKEYRASTVCRGVKQADLESNKRVAYIRLWLGTTEVSSVVVPRCPHPLVFARAQLQGSVARSFDGSLVGEKTFCPPVEKVPHIDVEFLDEGGHPYTDLAAWDHWTALLRLCVSNPTPLCRRV
jgi:hypothetical protein